ncbi:MAG TPA: flagellar export protein FliJ [Pyrinomonadaceae bacterium]|nr:flagellar export protein FliJ [Pyrinomonadaceae bacterium]
MKTKKYRLETVLGIRNRAREEAARQVAVRLGQLEQAEQELNRRQLKLQACYEQQNKAQTAMSEELNQGIQARNILAHQNYLNDLRKLEIELKNDVEKQIQAVTKAEKELETAREKLVETARELKSIEVHKENWQVSEQKAQNKREQKISDEIGAILHGRRDNS